MVEFSHKLNNLSINPEKVKVRTFTNISISFCLYFDLPINTIFKIRFRGGRNNKNDWYYLQPFDVDKFGYCDFNLNPNGNILPILTTGNELAISYLVCELNGIKQGTNFILSIHNTLVQSLVEINKKIEVFVKFPNKDIVILDNIPTIEVLNENFSQINLIAPSIASVNEKFEILIRIEDKFSNLFEGFNAKIQLFEMTENDKIEFIREINFELNNKGIVKIKDIILKKPGIFNIAALYKNIYYKSNPIFCKKDKPNKILYWGHIHGHSSKSDGVRDIEEYFQNLINAGLNFGNTTEHDHKWETSDDDFEYIKIIAKKYCKNNEFISFFGYEWGTWYSGYGDVCIYYFKDNIPIFRSEINKTNSIQKLVKNLKPYENHVLMIAHHTALRPGFRNWDYLNDSLERLVEIYSTWGNQEYSYKEGNQIPPRYKFFGYGKFARKKGPILEKRNSFVLDALKRGYKLGFTAGGDDHFGVFPSGSIEPDIGLYPSGIMAVWADDLSKGSVWNALYNRKCYGTTGPRVIIEFFINDYFMGDIIKLNERSNLEQQRQIKFTIISPINIERIELIRNGIVFIKKIVNTKTITHNIIDSDEFEKISLIHSINKSESFVFYYLRVFLSNENMAWSSPIWIIKLI